MQIPPDKNLEGDSKNWKNRMSNLSLTTCKECAAKHGTIFPYDVDESVYIPLHINGKCRIVPMRTKAVGTATLEGINGADYCLMYENRLPEYYISQNEAKHLGWSSKKGNLGEVAPGKMMGGKIYKNNDGKLPSASDRTWYEADINYYGGYRGHDRILFSSDGLLFVTYDHYQTYYEITR